MPPIDTLTIRRPDDWHVHLRDGRMLEAVLPHTAAVFARAIVMPNLNPPITKIADAIAYRERIMAVLPQNSDFTPLMTLYLTDASTPDTIRAGHENGIIVAAKLYPAHATTNSAQGITKIQKIMPTLEAMAECKMPLLVHGEVTRPDVDIFDREAVFIEEVLIPLRRDLPALRIVFEHITTKEAVDYVRDAAPGIGATITPHHLVLNRNAIFEGGLRPDAYCLPVAKREHHRQSLRKIATSGNERFFLGTDTAPHARSAKESSCGCAGIFAAPTAIQTYAAVFDEMAALHNLEAFASLNGPGFYGLPVNDSRLTLVRQTQSVPSLIHEEIGGLVPFSIQQKVEWYVRQTP